MLTVTSAYKGNYLTQTLSLKLASKEILLTNMTFFSKYTRLVISIGIIEVAIKIVVVVIVKIKYIRQIEWKRWNSSKSSSSRSSRE